MNGLAQTCATRSQFFEAGSTVVVQAVPNNGYVFIGWATATNQTIIGFQSTVTMNGPIAIYPRVRAHAQHQYLHLTARVDGIGRPRADYRALHAAMGIQHGSHACCDHAADGSAREPVGVLFVERWRSGDARLHGGFG